LYPGISELSVNAFPLALLPCNGLRGALQHECLFRAGFDVPFLTKSELLTDLSATKSADSQNPPGQS
jgi:hypothetical protein